MVTLSFEQIYKNNYSNLVRYFRFKTQNLLDSEELANDVLIKVFKHLAEFDEAKSGLTTWIYNISKNSLIDYFRTKNNTLKGKSEKYQITTDSTVDEEVFQVFQVPDKGIKSDSLFDTAIVAKSIETAINDLKGNNKDIAEAFFIYEFEYNEIAEMLDIPLGTVKGNINRIREKLQNQLKPEYDLICQ